MENRGRQPAVRAFLNSNPIYEGEALVDPWGQKYPMVNHPFVEILMTDFPAGDYRVKVSTPRKDLTEEVTIEADRPAKSVYLKDTSLVDLEQVAVNIAVTGKAFSMEDHCILSTYQIAGRALTKEGQPAFAYIWASRGRLVENEIIATTKPDGSFSIRCPAGRNLALFVGKKSYARTSLEGWVMADELHQDIAIPEIRIGDFEVYGLKVWYSASAWHIFFLPAKVGTGKPPALRASDLYVWIDDEQREITAFTEHMVAGDYPAYLLNVEAAHIDEYPQRVRVRVDSPLKGFGEAWFISG